VIGTATIVLLLLIMPFLGSLAVAVLPRPSRILAAAIAIGCMLIGLLGSSMLSVPLLAGSEPLAFHAVWAPSLQLSFNLRLDGFSWIFLMLIYGIGLLVCIYARYYMPPEDPVARLFSLLLAFAGAMIGIVLSGNIIQLVIFWEVTSLLSFLLIGYWHKGAAAREGARMALIVTSGGGLCLLAGLLLLASIAGSYELDVILNSSDLVQRNPFYGAALVLILLGAFTKSAQFPFHFWLPHAMAAPTPVSAYLHSATMVKAGVFLLVRLWPVLSGTDAWFWLVASIGLATLALGAFLAVLQNDLKGVLAYSTISHLGLITFLLGLNSPLACVAAIFHMVNHAIFKASLFMAAGAVDHEAGTRDMRKLGGLVRYMPFTAALATVAAAAMAGVPLLNGFLSKEMFFEETLAVSENLSLGILPVITVIATALSVVYSLRFLGAVFYGPRPSSFPRPPHEPPTWMVVPIGLLVLVCVAVGIWPAAVMGPYLQQASEAVLGARSPEFTLAVWHGFSPALTMSLIALGSGIVAYLLLRRRLRALPRVPFARLNGKRLFELALYEGAERFPRWLVRTFPANRLQSQLVLVIVVAIFAATLTLAARPIFAPHYPISPIDPAFALLWVVGSASAVGAALTAKFHRLAALIMVGGAGLISCISFVWLSAPDLATTQLLVEVVTTILMLLGLRWLPQRLRREGTAPLVANVRRGRDALLALAAGGGMALLAYAVMTHPVVGSISEFFLGHAYTEGGGHNVVNVILVDFRGFDTLGEITVLALVGLSVFALLRRFRPSTESIGPTLQKRVQDSFDRERDDGGFGYTLAEYMRVPGLITMLMAPVILLFAVHLFLRGHDLPGGGFVAGLTASIALILLYMAGGVRWVEARLRVAPVRWIAAGLLIALCTGLGSLLLGYPFLTSWFTYADLGWLGRAALPTAMAFDFGVLLLVVGATTLILTAIAHQSLRRPRAFVPPAGATAADDAGNP
jgi:multicomponent K+:H+ antiporter subunit A